MPRNFLAKDSVHYQTYFIDIKANPFVKWAGGKRQIINEIHNFLPEMIESCENLTYIEPFVGGGAVYFSLFPSPNIAKSILIDNNLSLIITYHVIKTRVNELITILDGIEQKYNNISEEAQATYFYETRDKFNLLIKSISDDVFSEQWLWIAAFFIFLNKTCFNGLYRVNSQGEFNVPRGSYNNPTICDAENLFHVHKALEKAVIIHGDFEKAKEYIDSSTFVYLDPPYRPIKNSSFTSYTKNDFDDTEQIRLANFCRRIHNLGGKFLLSNSDPKNIDPEDNFFEELYDGFNIEYVDARRNINSNGNERGTVTELLIMNY